MNAGDTLRAAAGKLRGMAKEATAGPWRDLPMGSDGSVVLAGGQTILTARRPARCGEYADATWIAAMSPAVAEPLAAWLDHSAEFLWRFHELGLYPFQALEFARLIMGDTDGVQG